MTEFETRLSECLDALTDGRWDIDECLRRNPKHAAELRPQLLAAVALSKSYAAEPREEFAAASRERFLVASGQSLQEAYDIEPSPTFFASARIRFLAAAQRMKLAQRQPERQPNRGWLPAFGTPFRALASAGAAVVIMLAGSTYTVAEASNSIPGDSLYGVKLQTERVRLALAFSEDAKRDIRIDLVAERSHEIEVMTQRGRIIGPGVLDRLSDQTAPLVAAAENNELDDGDLERLRIVTERQQTVLAEAAPQVAPGAKPQLEAAIAQAEQGSVIAAVARVNKPAPAVITPDIPLSSVTTPSPTSEPSETPDASATSGGASPTVSPTPARTDLVVDPDPIDIENGVSWVRLAVDRFTTLIPSEADGWRIAGLDVNDGPVAAPRLIRLANAENTSLITINPRNGDMYWFIAINGVFDEIIMRETRGGEVFVADRAVVQRLYGSASDVPFFVLDNIVITPEPTPTPAPRTATPTPAQ